MQAVMDFIHNPVAPIILAGVIVVLVAVVSFVVRSLKSSRTHSEVPPSTSVVVEASLPQAQESEAEGAQRSRDGPTAQTADLHEWDVFVHAWRVRELWANPFFLCSLAAIYPLRIGKRWKILFWSQIWAWKQPMS